MAIIVKFPAPGQLRGRATVEQAKDSHPLSGACSQLCWDNFALMPALRQMFGAQLLERISAIEVDEFGIKAQFERVQVD